MGNTSLNSLVVQDIGASVASIALSMIDAFGEQRNELVKLIAGSVTQVNFVQCTIQ